jgi:hypothetical protein
MRCVRRIRSPAILCQPAGQFQPHHLLPEAQHLRVVGEHRALHGEAVVSGDGADSGHLVGADRNAETGATHQQRAVGLALGDHASSLDGDIPIRVSSIDSPLVV